MSEQSNVTPVEGDALIVVDVQNDFLPPDGSLAVPEGERVVPVLNRYIETFRRKGLPVVATRDWHPEGHCSFQEQGGTWPPHCIAGSTGAEFAPDLALPEDAMVVSKATEQERDAYSGFQETGLATQLRALGVRRIFVGGLATDVCVLNTVRDGLEEGFEVYLLEDAIRAVNLQPDDGENAVAEMREGGAMSLRLDALADAA